MRQPARRRLAAGDRRVAAESPVSDAVAKRSRDGIHDDVAHGSHERRVIRDQRRLVPSFEQVPAPDMTNVEGACVAPVQPLHAVAEVRFGRLDHQVHVVGHQAVAQEVPALALGDRSKQPRVRLEVVVISKDAPAIDATRHHVVRGAGYFVAQAWFHAWRRTRRAQLRPLLRAICSERFARSDLL
jgi:hypothetical protein